MTRRNRLKLYRSSSVTTFLQQDERAQEEAAVLSCLPALRPNNDHDPRLHTPQVDSIQRNVTAGALKYYAQYNEIYSPES